MLLVPYAHARWMFTVTIEPVEIRRAEDLSEETKPEDNSKRQNHLISLVFVE